MLEGGKPGLSLLMVENLHRSPSLPSSLLPYPVAERGEGDDDEEGAQVVLGLHDVGQEGDGLDGLAQALLKGGSEGGRDGEGRSWFVRTPASCG